ncbi:DUF6283 family protein [Niveispirillum sp.]|uniref:DUF6283 family protein n=1 Tax=Niveispirillum sp. TaxID=1917217 RepID=UPI00345D0D4D
MPYRRQPCGGCPWLVRNVGTFPAEAFRLSANTAFDMSMHSFACHESGAEKPATCAGFLLRNAANNIGVRLAVRSGQVDLAEVKEPLNDPLWPSYRAMAIGNGVAPDDPAIARCRGDDEF